MYPHVLFGNNILSRSRLHNRLPGDGFGWRLTEFPGFVQLTVPESLSDQFRNVLGKCAPYFAELYMGAITAPIRMNSTPADLPGSLSADSETAFLGHVIQTQNDVATVQLDAALVMRIIVDRSRTLVGADGASLEMLDGVDLLCRCASGSLVSFVGFRLPINNSLVGACVESAQTLYCADTEQDRRVNTETCRRFNIRSMIVVPLMHHEAVVGVLRVTSGRTDGFNERAMVGLKLMANLMGASLTHARDFESKQRVLAERTAAIAALQESEERFRRSCEDASIGMALVALDGRWIKANRAMCEIVGYSEPELLRKDFQSMTHPDDLDADLSLLQQLVTGQIRTYQMSKRYIHRSGHLVWIQLNVSLVRDPSGTPLYFVSQVQNITERKQIEDALRDSEEAYRTMFDLAGAGMAKVDLRDGRFLAVNQKLGELLGYAPAELLAMSVHDITHPDDRSDSFARVEQMIRAAPGKHAYQKRYVRKDGQTIWVAVDATSFIHEPGRQVHVVAMVRDITEQRRADQAVRAMERQFRTLSDHAPVAIFQSDLDGNILFANLRWCQLTGIPAERAIGSSWYETVHEQDRAAVIEGHRGAIEKGQEYSGQHRYARPDGQVVWVQSSAAPLRDASEHVIGYLGTATDLTDRIHEQWLESDRREVLEMVAKDQSLHAVLDRIVRLLERQADGSVGAVFIIEDGALVMQAPNMPLELVQHVRQGPLPLASALIDVAWQDPDGVGVNQIEVDPIWSGLRPALTATGLRCCWTVPIVSADAPPLGLFSVFRRDNRRPTAGELDLLQMVGKLATISIEHHQTTRQLAHLVRHDRLTGLPNRLLLEDRLQHAMDLARRSGNQTALLALDLDRFKEVNDTLGHHAGDQLLQQFSQRLSSLLRASDTMARTGGDEFLIVLPEMADAAGVAVVAQKLLASMERPFELSAQSVHCSTSIGIAMFPADGSEIPVLQRHADTALYQVKQSGRRGFRFFTERTEAA